MRRETTTTYSKRSSPKRCARPKKIPTRENRFATSISTKSASHQRTNWKNLDINMSLTKLPHQIEARLPQNLTRSITNAAAEVHWTRAVAAGSLVASAVLLFTGRRKAAVAVAAAGAAVAVLENPEAARDLWKSIPGHLQTGQELLVKAEGLVEDIVKKGEKLQRAFTRS